MNAGQQGGDDKNSMQILWIIFGVFMVGAGIWWGFQRELKLAFIFVNLWELKICNFVFEFLHIKYLQSFVAPSLSLAEKLYTSPELINAEMALKLATDSGKLLRYPIVVFLLICGYFLYVKNIKVKFRKSYSMKTLMKQEKHLWPQVEVVSELGLEKVDLDEGPWAMGLTPMQFCKKNKLITIEVERGVGFGANFSFKTKLNHDKAEKIFAGQLGRAWRGPDHMAPHRKALFAVFMARGCRDTKIARTIVENLNRTIGSGKEAIYDHVDEMIKKHYDTKIVQEICRTHAYETTLITSMLLFARQDGVLAVSDFLWLKPLDRRLWYTLNNVGRQTPYAEAAGVHAHWLAEKSLDRLLTVPVVKEATKALQLALDEIIYVPTPDEKAKLLEKFKKEHGL